MDLSRRNHTVNIVHLKYAVEVARQGSINKAADALMMGQPNLSRAIRELEQELGITLFERSAKGMVVTGEGEEFLTHARRVLRDIEQIESMYRTGMPKRQRFSLSAPHAYAISRAFARFAATLSRETVELFFKETYAMDTVENVVKGDFNLGVVRYPADQAGYYETLLAEKGLVCLPLHACAHVLILSRHSPLLQMENPSPCALCHLMEIVNSDAFAPAIQLNRKGEGSHQGAQHAYLFDRLSQLEVLSATPHAYMWDAPLPQSVLDAYQLTVKEMPGRPAYQDALIHRKDYTLTRLDQQFLAQLKKSYSL